MPAGAILSADSDLFNKAGLQLLFCHGVDQRTGQAVKGLKCHRVFPLVLTPLTGREVMAVTL